MTTTENFATRNDPVQIRTPDRCRLAVRGFGPEEAPPVLLLGGREGGMQRWRGLLPELRVDDRERTLFAEAGCVRSLAEHLRVVVFDARGAGWSSRSHGVAPTVKEAAADAIAVAAAIFEGPFHLVGHSLGGCIAQEAALAAGKLVTSLTLISTTAGGEAWVGPDEEYRALAASVGDPFVAPDASPDESRDPPAGREEARQDEALRCVLDEVVSPAFATAHPDLLAYLAEEVVRAVRWERRFAVRGARVREAAAALAARDASPDLAGRLGGLRVPTLVVHGRRDRPIPPANGAYLAEHIPGARLELLDGGHDLTLERPAELIDLIHRHVAGSALR